MGMKIVSIETYNKNNKRSKFKEDKAVGLEQHGMKITGQKNTKTRSIVEGMRKREANTPIN